MSIIQTFGHYTGQGDIDKVKQGTTNLDVENVTQQIAGKPKFISDNSKDVGTFTFHQKNQSGQNIETYYVKGKWYFTETDKSLRHISGLSALFGNQNIDRIPVSQLKFLYPLKTLVFPAFSPPRFGPFPSFFPLREEMRETFFRLSLQPYPAALRKFAWPLWWRGRKCSSWYLHQNVPAAPAHPWVRPRERGCGSSFVSTAVHILCCSAFAPFWLPAG